jgi:hypothetical protein
MAGQVAAGPGLLDLSHGEQQLFLPEAMEVQVLHLILLELVLFMPVGAAVQVIAVLTLQQLGV